MTKTDGAHQSDNIVKLHEGASERAKGVGNFVKDHPLLVVAGGIVLGAIAASLLPRGTGRKLAKQAVNLAEVAGTAGALLGSRVRDKAEETGSTLREQGGLVAERLERLGESASESIGKLGGKASAGVEKLIDPVETVASKVVRKASELRSRVRH